MISINLLPHEFRKVTVFTQRTWLRPRYMKLAGCIFVLITIIFYIQFLFYVKTYSGLQKKWPALYANAQRVAQIRNEVQGGIKSERDFIAQYLVSPLSTTVILSAISEFLPSSMWLVEVKLTRQPKENIFILKGLTHSEKGRTGMQEVEKYLKLVKEKFPPETRLTVTTSHQERERVELTFFTAIFKWV